MLVLLILRWPCNIDVLFYDLFSLPSNRVLALFDVHHGPLSEHLSLTDALLIYGRPLPALLDDQSIFNNLQLPPLHL